MALPKGKDELTFIEHLEELRWHLARSLAAVSVISVVVFLLPGVLFDTIILDKNRKGF